MLSTIVTRLNWLTIASVETRISKMYQDTDKDNKD